MKIGLFTDALADRPLPEVLALAPRSGARRSRGSRSAPAAIPPPATRTSPLLLDDADERRRWSAMIADRGYSLSALNVSGNPLHPDADYAARHTAALRDTIRLAALLGVDRVVAMSGCPGAGPGDRTAPHFGAGGWLPDLEKVAERQWTEVVLPFWTEMAAFAAREHPGLLICFELHPGTYVYNTATFGMIRGDRTRTLA